MTVKIAVTTANGNLGSAIIRQLNQDLGTQHVIGIARTPTKAEGLGVEIRKGDYNSQEDFEQALAGVDAVLVVSANGDPAKRVEQHRNIIQAAKKAGVSKIVYTSILGSEEGTAFNPVVNSNRQTEADLRNSGLQWVIGRNGLYIEPDLEAVNDYIKAGKIANCAGDGLCAYTSRPELACAYARILQEEKHNGHTYNLVGEPIKQSQLVSIINEVFDTQLVYEPMSVADYLEERKAALGEFLGTVIGGIYEGIRNGDFNAASDFTKAAGRPHQSALEMVNSLKR